MSFPTLREKYLIKIATFDAALKKVAERAPLPKHEPKKRKPKG